MSAHTSGPWSVYAVSDAISDVTNEKGVVVVNGSAFIRPGVPIATSRKNAILVAAAPDLLVQLSTALHYLKNPHLQKNPDCQMDHHIQAIESALLKARGL